MKKKVENEKLPIDRFEAEVNVGLSNEQVLERTAKGYANTQPKRLSKSFSKIVTTNIFTLFNLLNIVLGILVIVFGELKNALFLGVMFFNIVIGIIQEVRSKITVEKLSLLSQPKITVLRDSVEHAISIEEIVIDDILVFSAGNQIPSDCTFVEGSAEVNESLLTGEQDAVKKHIGDKLLSGSFVVSGNCKGMVESVGSDNYASKIVESAKKYKKPNSELMRSIQWIIRVVSILMLVVGPMMLFNHYKITTDTKALVQNTVASLVGMTPNGLVLLTSMALAVGVVKLSKKRTLVQELYCIETLARVDMLCLDKTGTITEGTMQVEDTLLLSTATNVNDIIGNMTASLKDSNATFTALRNEYKAQCKFLVKDTMPFSSEKKMSAVSFENLGTYIIGAPEFVLKSRFKEVKKKVDASAELGYRVLVLVHTKNDIKEDKDFTIKDMDLVALIVLSDKIRENAKETLEYFARQGVKIKIISGDNPLTVSKIAQRVGLIGAEDYVDATTLDTEDKIFEAVKKYTIFGRVTPIQKRQLVQALKKQKYTVGMTGDGVNDVMALKEADCSIAMASGSDAARHTSQLVLLDNNFSALPDVVAEGRRVVNNISRAASLFLVKTTFSIILSIMLIVMELPFPFENIQLTLISSIFIGVPSMFLAVEPNNKKITGNFLSKVVNYAVPAGITIAVLIGVAYQVAGIDYKTAEGFAQICTICTYIYAITQYYVLFYTCKPYTVGRMLLFIVCTIAFGVCVIFFRPLFSLVALPQHSWLIITVLVFALYPIMKLSEMIISLTGKSFNIMRAKYVLHKKKKEVQI
ncbi:MAG: HAD-IC family P-type ATPase [Clostridia bacterium]